MDRFRYFFAAAVLCIAALSCTTEKARPVEPDAEAVNGRKYVGLFVVNGKHEMQDAAFYVGDIDEEKGTCTLFLPAYEMPAMGKMMPMPAFAVPAVTMKKVDNIITYSRGRYEKKVGGTLYKFKDGISGRGEVRQDGTITLALDYKITPGAMPFPLGHHFEGTFTEEYGLR